MKVTTAGSMITVEFEASADGLPEFLRRLADRFEIDTPRPTTEREQILSEAVALEQRAIDLRIAAALQLDHGPQDEMEAARMVYRARAAGAQAASDAFEKCLGFTPRRPWPRGLSVMLPTGYPSARRSDR